MTPEEIEAMKAAMAALKEDNERLAKKVKIEAEHRTKAEKDREALTARLGETEAEKAKLAEEAARKAAEKGDVKALEASWQAKYDKAIKEKADSESRYKSMIQDATAKKEAAALSARLFGDRADVLGYHVERRLRAEVTDEGIVTRVLDEKGEISAKTVDELYAEIKGSDKFAPFVVASHGSGGGAPGGKGGSGASGAKTMKRDEYMALSNDERRTLGNTVKVVE